MNPVKVTTCNGTLKVKQTYSQKGWDNLICHHYTCHSISLGVLASKCRRQYPTVKPKVWPQVEQITSTRGYMSVNRFWLKALQNLIHLIKSWSQTERPNSWIQIQKRDSNSVNFKRDWHIFFHCYISHLISDWSLDLFPLVPNVGNCCHEVSTVVHWDWTQ